MVGVWCTCVHACTHIYSNNNTHSKTAFEVTASDRQKVRNVSFTHPGMYRTVHASRAFPVSMALAGFVLGTAMLQVSAKNANVSVGYTSWEHLKWNSKGDVDPRFNLD